MTTTQSLFQTVLIVDDNEADRYLLRRLLKKADVAGEFVEQEHGRDALEWLMESEGRRGGDTDPPLLIMVDINMPIMGGFGFLEKFGELREAGKYRSAVLMMFSSSSHERDRERVKDYDFVRGYVVKIPASPAELRASIEEIVSST